MIRLDKKSFSRIIPFLQSTGINHMFAEAVVRGHVDGKVFVDNPSQPTNVYINHPYGMSLLLGDAGNEEFNAWLLRYALNPAGEREAVEWLQAYPAAWNDFIKANWAEHLQEDNDKPDINKKIEIHTRVNFRFNPVVFSKYKQTAPTGNVEAVRTDMRMFSEMEGAVVPSRFWNNAEDFNSRGVAFSVVEKGKVASTAFSAFVIGQQLEIGIETNEGSRGRGYAENACSALISYCLEHNLEPVWACRLANTASYKLAMKLGFEPVLNWPFYRLG